ncbi:MAG: NADH-quinone oxidoreductase subunit E [Dasania sp.]|jgi:NADH-quinone oxidoreductase subunit E
MSIKRPAKIQPQAFEFTPETLAKANKLLENYPQDRKQSAVIPLLWFVQKQHHNWLPLVAIKAVADFLGMAEIRVYEVVTFYTMFNLAPVGQYFVQVCGTTPCLLAGSDEIIKVCKQKITTQESSLSDDQKFSWLEVECLGACSNAPMVQINDDYFEDLNADSFTNILDALKHGQPVKAGPQNGRFAAEPLGGATCLTEFVDPEIKVNATIALCEKV